MPRVLTEETAEEKSRYLKRLFSETYVKDVVERNRIHGAASLLKCCLTSSRRRWGPTNLTRLASRFASERKVGIGHTTIDTCLRYFQETFIIEKADRFDVLGGGCGSYDALPAECGFKIVERNYTYTSNRTIYYLYVKYIMI